MFVGFIVNRRIAKVGGRVDFLPVDGNQRTCHRHKIAARCAFVALIAGKQAQAGAVGDVPSQRGRKIKGFIVGAVPIAIGSTKRADQTVAQALIGIQAAGVIGCNAVLAVVAGLGFNFAFTDLAFVRALADVVDQAAGVGCAVGQ